MLKNNMSLAAARLDLMHLRNAYYYATQRLHIDPYPCPKRQILHSSKLKESADYNFKFDENGRKFSK